MVVVILSFMYIRLIILALHYIDHFYFFQLFECVLNIFTSPVCTVKMVIGNRLWRCIRMRYFNTEGLCRPKELFKRRLHCVIFETCLYNYFYAEEELSNGIIREVVV